MQEKPIIFGGEMVRAILEGRKTQTRRVIKPQPSGGVRWNAVVLNGYGGWTDGHGAPLRCPYGKPGDRLWVRETWGIYSESWTDYGWEGDGIRDMAIPKTLPLSTMHTKYHVVYKESGYEADEGERWRPSIHMPRWASRLTLEITDVRAERIKELSWADAIAEGITNRDICKHCDSAQMAFREKWDAINAKRGYSWDSNPWVWAITFRVVTP